MSISVLVADASEEFGTLIRHTLEETGRYKVTLVETGTKAIEVSQNSEIQLAIIDFDLPDIPGPDCIRQLRTVKPDIAVIAIPYFANPDDPELDTLQLNGLLTKPFYLPELVRIVSRALDSPSDDPETQSKPLQNPIEATPLGQAASNPLDMDDLDRSNQYLTGLTAETTAVAALLTRGQNLVTSAGELEQIQIQALTDQITEYWASKEARGAIAKYIRLPGTNHDFMLYITDVVPDVVLSLVYNAETPFGIIRQQANQLAKALSEPEPLEHMIQAEVELPPPIEITAEYHELDSDSPRDWIPETTKDPGEIPFLENLNPPPPDPEPNELPVMFDSIQTPDDNHSIPGDWVPNQPRPASHLPYLDEPAQKPPAIETHARTSVPLPEAKYHLAFTAILLPRFPEHRLTGSLAQRLEEWVKRLCLAWDWRADKVILGPEYLSMTISFSPEIAPDHAVRQLIQDLSERVFDTFPELVQDLPSKRFWARSYFLTAGDQPSSDQIRDFIKDTRRAQGLEI